MEPYMILCAAGWCPRRGTIANKLEWGGVGVSLDDTADLSVPLSNSYAQHAVHDSAACRALCTAQQARPRASLFGDKHATVRSLHRVILIVESCLVSSLRF